MHRRFARSNPFNPFTVPGMLFAADDGGGGGDAAAQAAAQAATEAAAKTAADEAAAKAAAEDDKTDWKAEAHKWEKRSKDNKTALDTATSEKQSTLDAIAKAFGLKGDDDPVKAAQTATEERDAARLETKATRIENAVLRAAAKNGADPEALTDSRSFMHALEAIDPTADDFAAQVGTAIKTAVEANPALKSGPVVPGKSGGQVIGGGPVKQSDDPQQRARDYYESAPTK